MIQIKVKREFQNSETQKNIEAVFTEVGEIQITYQFDKRPIQCVTLFLGQTKETLLKALLSPMIQAGQITVF